jgi:hypothetical protein
MNDKDIQNSVYAGGKHNAFPIHNANMKPHSGSLLLQQGSRKFIRKVQMIR